MIIDLGPLPYTKAIQIVNFCVENGIEPAKCYKFLHYCTYGNEEKNLDLRFDIPDKYITYFLMKWS